jgi:hypothetical protein
MGFWTLSTVRYFKEHDVSETDPGRFRLYENKVSRKICGLMTEEVTDGCTFCSFHKMFIT